MKAAFFALSPSQPFQGRHATILPTNGCSLELCIPFLKLTNKEQASRLLETWSLAANVTRNMTGGLLTITCTLLVLSNKGNVSVSE